jgi:hypothetical protein
MENDFVYGSRYSVPRRIISTSDGGYAMTGVVSNEVANTDIFICKTNSIGDTLWTYRKDGSDHDNDNGNWILENSENNLLVLGRIRNPTTFGYLGLFDLNGNIEWEEIVGDNEIWYEHFYAIDLPEEQNYLMSTLYKFYKVNYNYTDIEWIGDNSIGYFQKLENEFISYIGGIDGVQLKKTDNDIVSVQENIIFANQNYLKCYPNPFKPSQQRNSGITINFENFKNNEDSQVNIYNIKGRRVKQFEISKRQNSIQWNGANANQKQVSSGVYFVTLNSGGKTIDFKKITIIK